MRKSKPDYQQTLEWANDPHEKILITWDIKKIIHNWVKPVIVFMVIMHAIFIPFIILLFWYSPAVSTVPIIWAAIIGEGFFLSLLYLEVCRKNQLVYRLTDKGIDIQRWRVYPDFLFSWSKGMLVLMGGLALLIGIFTKTGLLAIIGPVAIVFSMFIKVTTSDYKRMMVNHKNEGAFWKDIERIEYDPNRKLVRLHYQFDVTEEEINYQLSLPNVVGVITSGTCYLFMTKENEQQVLGVLKQCLPNLSMETHALELPDNDN